MKKYPIIIISVLLLGLFGLQLLRQNETNPHPEIDGESEGDSIESAPGAARSSGKEGIKGSQPAQEKEKTTMGSAKTPWEKGDFPERLQIADLDMPLVFEGQVSQVLKQVILADIHLLYSSGVTYEKYDWSGRTDNPVFDFSGQSHVSSETINLRASQVPDIVHKKLGRIVQVNGIASIIVPAELISAYEEAWEARKASPEKYESLGPFIEWLNAAPMDELKNQNPYWLFGYDGVSDAYPERAEEMRKSLLREDLRVGYPSILEFTYVNQEVLEEEGAQGQLPVGVTLADGKYINEQGVPYQQALFLYDGKKWHIAFAPPGS